ncbi:MAG: hypothetical protein RLY31_1180 [Bacteroidota bacterium]|jgi:hypothetical protein
MIKKIHFIAWGMLLFLLLPKGLSAQPSNDDCADAEPIGAVQDFSFTTVGANTDGPYHPAACTGGAADSLYNDVWYLFTPAFTGTAEFTTCNTADFDTNIAVYAPGSACPPEESDLVACNEDGAGCSGYTSKLTFDVVAGESYLLRIGGWGTGSPGEEGSGTFTVGEYVPVTGPVNDECDNAIVLDLGPEDSVFVTFSTANATTSEPYHETGPAGCLDANEPVPYNDVWYVWTATFSGYVEYSNCGTATFDSKIAVYGPNQNCPPDPESLVACGDDGCPGYTSLVTFPVEKDSTYLFRMGGWSNSDAGLGSFTVKRIPPPVPPANDLCTAYDTAWVTPVETADEFDPVFIGFTANGSASPGLGAPGCVAGNEYTDVWYRFNSGNNTQLTLRINKITANTQYAVELYDDCGTLTDAVDGPGFCFYTGDEPGDFVSADLPNFPGVPTEYFLRIATDLTYDAAGEFFFQLLGEPYTNTTEAVPALFRVWPNPATTQLTIQASLPAPAAVRMSVLNALGQLVAIRDAGQFSAGRQQWQLPIEGMDSGFYLLHLQMGETVQTVRFVKH